jgi:hypothetical protein
MSKVAVGSIAGLADWLSGRGPNEAYQAVLGFVGETSHLSDEEFLALVTDIPASTGDLRVDSLIAATVEHLLSGRQMPIPDWCVTPDRFLTSAWFPVDLPSIRVRALVSSPASFWRRLIFIDRSDLRRA